MSPVHHRVDCRACGGRALQVVVPLAPIPITTPNVGFGQGARHYGNIAGIEAPLDLHRCGDCGHLQLLDVVDPDLQYGEFLYTTSISLGLPAHFERMGADLIDALELRPGSTVIEIGSNDGTLLRLFQVAGMRVLGIDPAREIAERASAMGIETLATFFTAEAAVEIVRDHGPADLVIANNTLANIDDLGDCLVGVRTLLKDDGVFVFETSYGADVIDGLLLDTIYHEHLSYFMAETLPGLMARHDMALFDLVRVETKVVVPLAPIPITTPNVGFGQGARHYGNIAGIEAPLDLHRCASARDDCGHLQLLDVVDPDLQYGEFLYTTSISLGLPAHFERMGARLDLIDALELRPGSTVIEIGTGFASLPRLPRAQLDDWTLLRLFQVAAHAGASASIRRALRFRARLDRRVRSPSGDERRWGSTGPASPWQPSSARDWTDFASLPRATGPASASARDWTGFASSRDRLDRPTLRLIRARLDRLRFASARDWTGFASLPRATGPASLRFRARLDRLRFASARDWTGFASLPRATGPASLRFRARLLRFRARLDRLRFASARDWTGFASLPRATGPASLRFRARLDRLRFASARDWTASLPRATGPLRFRARLDRLRFAYARDWTGFASLPRATGPASLRFRARLDRLRFASARDCFASARDWTGFASLPRATGPASLRFRARLDRLRFASARDWTGFASLPRATGPASLRFRARLDRLRFRARLDRLRFRARLDRLRFRARLDRLRFRARLDRLRFRARLDRLRFRARLDRLRFRARLDRLRFRARLDRLRFRARLDRLRFRARLDRLDRLRFASARDWTGLRFRARLDRLRFASARDWTGFASARDWTGFAASARDWTGFASLPRATGPASLRFRARLDRLRFASARDWTGFASLPRATGPASLRFRARLDRLRFASARDWTGAASARDWTGFRARLDRFRARLDRLRFASARDWTGRRRRWRRPSTTAASSPVTVLPSAP